MSSIEFEIGIQRKFGNSWPVVVRVKQPDGLTTHTEGTLQLREEDLIQLKQQQENYLEYGTILGKALFQDRVRETFVRTLGQSIEGATLRVLLSNEADGQDEVRSLHWERLCAPIDAGGAWNLLARDQRVLFSQYIPTIIERRFHPIGRRDLRALVVVASPTNLGKYNLAEFNVEQAVNSVRDALGDIPCDVLANLDGAIGSPTLEQLSARLTNAKKPYTLLHFVCHGMLGKDGETALFWATKDNQVQRVTGADLLKELKYIGNKQGLPHLTFLCSCETAEPRAEGALGGLAQRLVRDLGMPAVVAMTRKVSVETALNLGQKFYQRLRESGEVDLALQEATAGLGHRQDITVPALFSRLGGRPLFSDRLEERELTDAEIESGLEELGKLIKQRAPNATVLKESFEQQVQILNQTQGSELPAARQQRRQALDELNILCSQMLEISFDAIAALDKKPPEYDAECPFPGLSSFRAAKYHKFFFGREQLVAELQQALSKDNFLAVLGPSGSGKSSVVLAGLIPQLKLQQPSLQMAYLTPSSEPVAELQGILKKVPKQPVVLVVDQFEELFTLCSDERQRLEFIEQLLQLAQSRRVVITMRADFLGECTFYEQLRQRVEQNSKLIGPMDAAQLGKAMKMQADQAYLEFEEGLNNAILAEVELEPGAMPLLQYALRSLWNRRWGRFLCYEEYEAIGGVHQAISQTADAVYDSLSAVEQEQVKNIFIRLTRLDDQTVGGEQQRDTRRRVGLEELVPSGDDPTVTKRLVQRLAGEGARLVVTSRDEVTGKEEVEVAHESLIRYWYRLQKWLEENRSNLQLRETIRQAALEWSQQEKEENYLVHRGGRLEDAEVLLQQPRFLNRLEADYVTACVELRERLLQQEEERRQRELEQERKARKAAQRTTVGAVIATVVLAGLSILAGITVRKSEIDQLQTSRTTSEQFLSSNQGLEALTEILKVGRKLESSIWQAVWPDPNLRSKVTETLHRVVYGVKERNRLSGHQDRVFEVNFSPNGKLLATTEINWGPVRFWDLEGKQVTTFQEHQGLIENASFSPNGKLVATADENGIARLWNLEGKQVARLEGSVRVIFSPDSKLLATISKDNSVGLWDMDGKQLAVLTGHSVIFGPYGKLLATLGRGRILLWDLDGKLVTEFEVDDERDPHPDGVAFSSDDQFLAVAENYVDGDPGRQRVTLRDLKGNQVAEFKGHTSPVYNVTFSPDGKLVATASHP